MLHTENVEVLPLRGERRKWEEESLAVLFLKREA
jgi:hypothetical protein